MNEQGAIKDLQEYIGSGEYNGTNPPIYLETATSAIRALEKMIPKTVYHFLEDDTFETMCCGIEVTGKDYKYCPECGQLLGDVEEVKD